VKSDGTVVLAAVHMVLASRMTLQQDSQAFDLLDDVD